jgi:hypothetical protein
MPNRIWPDFAAMNPQHAPVVARQASGSSGENTASTMAHWMIPGISQASRAANMTVRLAFSGVPSSSLAQAARRERCVGRGAD